MTAPDIMAALFAVAYVIGAFILAMGAAVIGRFAVELVRTVKR